MSKHIKEFFICPHCKRPRYSKEELEERISNGIKGCGNCGKDFTSSLPEALEESKKVNQESKHIKEFFVCPHCKKPRYLKEELEERVYDGVQCCSSCGKEIASALLEALTEAKGTKHN